MANNMVLNIPIGHSVCGIGIGMAMKLLSEADPAILSTFPAVRPSGGQLYLVYCGDNNEKKGKS